MPSFKQRDRAKRVEPVEAKRVVGNERSALIDRVLQALEKPAAAQEAAPSIQPASRETAAQAAARIAEPEPAPTRANLIDRVLARLRGEPAPAQSVAEGMEAVARDDQSLTGRVAQETAKLIRDNDNLARAIDDAAAGRTKPQQRRDIESDLERLRADYRERFRGLAQKVVAGDIPPSQFRRLMGKEVKKLQTQAAILGAGGQGNMTDNQRRLLDRSVKDQLAYLDGFVRDIREHVNAGKPVPQRMISRAGSYAAAADVTADQARRQSMADEVAEDSADLWEVRVLGVAEHCNDCVELAGRPAPVGTLPPIGDSECGQYCKCRFEYGPREELERKYGRGAS